jgi:hypothetical protein
MRLDTPKNGVNVHTKISAANKRTVEKLSKRADKHENVIFNTALARGLAKLKTEIKAK